MSCDQSAMNNCCQVGRFPAAELQSDCSEVKCSAAVRRNSCSCETCCGRKAVVVQDDCKGSGARGQQVCGCFKPVCQHNPCHDHGLKTVVQDERRRPCGNEVSVSVNKLKGVCCTPVCDQQLLQLTDRKL